MIATFAPGDSRDIVDGLLRFGFVPNHYGAMGLFGDRPAVLIALALAVIVVLAMLMRETLAGSALAQTGFALIVGGACGNVLDRTLHGFVVDFIALPHFYVFNVADSCISVGLVLILLAGVLPRGCGRRALE